MCGIAGILDDQGVKLSALKRMADALRHRGPDDEGYYTANGVGLAHRRLSIIDLDTGRQPIGNEDDSIQIIFNGEIYNYHALYAELCAQGHRFKTRTDTEVILHLFEEHGPDCVTRLRGMFAFAIWNQRTRTLFLARDHMGQKPLFFHQRDGVFAFASEPKALLASGIVKPELDLNGLWHYVSLRYLPDRYTMFKGIEKLPAGSWLRYRDGQHTIQRYWSPDFRRKEFFGEDETVDRLDALLQETTKEHMVSDVPVGAFLSGGIDSSTVAAMMAKASDAAFPAFSIGVKEQKFDELPFARTVAKQYGLTHREKVVEADLIHLIPAMVYHMDEPADPFAAGVYLVSQIAAEEVKVVLGGDGGDENFAGYDRYAGQGVVDHYRLLPQWFRRLIMRPIVASIPQSFGYKSLAQKAAWVNDLSFFDGGDRYAQSLSYLRFTQTAKERLFTSDARRSIDDVDSTGKILGHFNSDRADHPVDRMLYTDLMTRMPDHLLALVDRMSMAHSLETRSPLVDYKVVEFAAAIPADLKLKGRTLKHILKRVAARHLPGELIHRTKQGFGFPLAIWMRDELSTFLRRLFAQSRFVELGLFDGNYVHALLEEHLQGKADHNFRLWILLNLEFWYRIYFENVTPDELHGFIEEATPSTGSG